MTQPLCQVRILTPASGRCERLRARLDQAEPDLLRASCRHWPVLPPPEARDGDVFLLDHQPAAGCEHLPDLPRPSLPHLYRIAREAVSNARRHGRADAVAIRLACCEGTVRDAGRGFDPAGGEEEARQSGLGLRMMHYRAHLLGGTLTVRPGLDGAGTLVTCAFDPALDQDRSSGRTA